MMLLPEVEQALLDAISRDQAARRTSRLSRASRLKRIRVRSLRLPALALLALLGTTTIALAASGVILTGSNVPSQRHPRPRYGLGVPAPGRSKLLPLRVRDPAGGLPWGMRVIDTTRGYLCVELGRVHNGRLGELGIDGAFHDDGLFHPLPVGALPEGGGFLAREIFCDGPSDSGFAGTIVGVEPSAAGGAIKTNSRSRLREISFGLLGEHAREITYRAEGGAVETSEVLPGLGAYLIVRRATHGGQLGSLSEAPVAKGKPVVNPIGALTSIAYDFGKRTCVVASRKGDAEAECGFSEGPPPKPKPLPVVHEHPHLQLMVHNHTITAAYLVFRAPYPVTSAMENYLALSDGCGRALTGGGIEHDVLKGATLHLSIASSLSHACSRSVKVKLYYVRSIDDNIAPTKLATVTVHIPRGDHVRPRSRRVRQGLREAERSRKRR